MSKGSVRRNGNTAKFDENFDKIFGGHKKTESGNFVQDPNTGKLIDRDLRTHRPRVNAPTVHRGIKEFRSPIDQSMITSRAKLAAHNKRHGVTDMRDYSGGFLKQKEKERVDAGQKHLKETRRVDINQAIDKHS